MFRRSTQSRRQPVFRLSINPKYAQYVSTARVWNLPPTLDVDARLDKISAFAKTGTIDVDITPSGIGVKGDGTTGLYSRATSVVPQAMWMAAQFVCNSVSINQKTAYGMGSSAVTTGAYCGIFSGDSASSNIVCQLRAIDGSVSIGKTGLTPVVGTTYTIVAVFPSGLKADAYIYVNGIKYTTDFASSSDITFVGANTLVNEAVGALKRGTTAVYSSDTVLFTAHGLGLIPEALAKRISENPYTLLQPQQRSVFDTTSGSTTGDGSATITFACSGIGHALFNGIGSSAIAFTGSGVGESLAASVGASAITFNAPGVGTYLAGSDGAGVVSISFTASGIGKSTSVAIGNASISFNASAVGTYPGAGVLTPAVGSATISFNTTGYGNALQSYTWNDITYSSSTWTDIQPPSDIWTDIITP